MQIKKTIRCATNRLIQAIEVLQGNRLTITKTQAVWVATAAGGLGKSMKITPLSGGTINQAIALMQIATIKLRCAPQLAMDQPLSVDRGSYPPIVAVPPTNWDLN